MTTAELPVADDTTPSGEAILVATEPPDEVAARLLGEGPTAGR
jgi:hypothetical protein